jgi:hypothetical protein
MSQVNPADFYPAPVIAARFVVCEATVRTAGRNGQITTARRGGRVLFSMPESEKRFGFRVNTPNAKAAR